jgi:scyllo-inositol 2-dehydrogenase (NADP+)
MRYVVVGYGNIGAKRKQLLGVRCVATVDPYNAAADYRVLEECPLDHYDAVVLSVPNALKIAMLDFLLNRGKHALVEKPLVFPDEATAHSLQHTAEDTGAIWYTSYNFRFEPHIVRLRQLLAARTIGEVYRARLFYGYGTAGNVAGTWRDDRLGVLQDLGSHLIDLVGFVFGRFGSDFVVWERRAHELTGIDHCILATADRRVVIECSYLSWKNRWAIEVIGARGALQMDGLTKWGASELTIQRRRLPSGIPEETREVATAPDPTWAADLAHFEAMVAAGQTSLKNDVWVSRTLQRAATCPLN